MGTLLEKLNPQLNSELVQLQKHLAYEFSQRELLEEAVLHRSALGPLNTMDSSGSFRDNDTLEFLGDAVLDLAMTNLIMQRCPDLKAGELSKVRASLVNEAALVTIAENIGLGRALVLGPGERPAKPSILADGVEALIGAIFKERGLDAAQTVIEGLFTETLSQDLSVKLGHDSKTDFQEWSQKKWNVTPHYRCLKTDGPAHARTFEVGVYVGNELKATASGHSKKVAEQNAASVAMKNLNIQAENLSP